MKPETAQKLSQLIEQNKLEFNPTDDGISIEYDLSDDQLSEIVQIEYGQTSQDVVQLFTAILKKAVKMAVEKTKEDESK